METLVMHGEKKLTTDLDRSIINDATGSVNTVKYRESFIIAAVFEEISLQQLFAQVPSLFDTDLTQLTATYNTIPLHSRPLAQNYISNTLLRNALSITSHLLILSLCHNTLIQDQIDNEVFDE